MKPKKNRIAPSGAKRERRASSQPPRLADTLAQAAGILGCTVAGLKALRASGSTAFDHGRVNLAKAREELASMPPPPDAGDLEDKEILERRKLRAQYLKEEFRLDVEKRRFVSIEEVTADLIRIASAERAEDMRLVGDVGSWEGLSAAEMNRRARAWLDAKCATLSDQTSKLYT